MLEDIITVPLEFPVEKFLLHIKGCHQNLIKKVARKPSLLPALIFVKVNLSVSFLGKIGRRKLSC